MNQFTTNSSFQVSENFRYTLYKGGNYSRKYGSYNSNWKKILVFRNIQEKLENVLEFVHCGIDINFNFCLEWVKVVV